jgi:adenylate cyclase
VANPNDEMWRRLLSGNDPDLVRMQRLFGRIPSAPRCKLCHAPFGRPGSLVLKPFGWGRWEANPTLCRICGRGLDRGIGGAEIDSTFLFADIRGSTGLAEEMRPAAFRELLERFYRIAAAAIDDAGGLLDKYLGDGVVAFFVPVFSGQGGPAASAIRAGRALLAATVDERTGSPWVPIGVGVHSGPAFVGVMGTEGGALDFTGVGDTVNTAARLGSVAGAGELLVSRAAVDAAGLDVTGREERTLELKGRTQPIDAVVLHATDPSEATGTTDAPSKRAAA